MLAKNSLLSILINSLLIYKRAHNVTRYSWSIIFRTFHPGFQGEEDYDHPVPKPTVMVQSSQFESWTDEYFKEQVPVANPNYGKSFFWLLRDIKLLCEKQIKIETKYAVMLYL